VKGFSSLGIIMKHVGASFLVVNAILTHGNSREHRTSILMTFISLIENLPVVVYGGVNVVQHSLFLIQYVAIITGPVGTLTSFQV